MPGVIAFGSSGAFTWLLQRLIVSGIDEAVDFEEHFGRLLASLHRHSADGFGHVPDNWIGSLPQRNANCDRWTDFFREQRIDPLLREAISLKLLPRTPRSMRSDFSEFGKSFSIGAACFVARRSVEWGIG